MKVKLTQTAMSAMLVNILSERHPELDKLYTAAKTAASIEGDVKAARKAADEAHAEQGTKPESLFAQTKETAISLAFADNGPDSEPGIAGQTVLDYFKGRAAMEGLPDNTGKSYARLAGLTTEALRQALVTVEEVRAWTRPDAQRFFASDVAAARTDVKKKVGELVKGASAEFCTELAAAIDAFTAKWASENPQAATLVNGEPAH